MNILMVPKPFVLTQYDVRYEVFNSKL